MKIEVIAPAKFALDPSKILASLETGLDMAAEDIGIDFNVTTQTWKKRPTFLIEKLPLERRIYTTDKIYKFISRGTRVRYATMTPDFVAKTVPRSIRSRMGQGGVAMVNIKKPMPGIQARDYEVVISEKWKKRFGAIFQQAIFVEVQKQQSINNH